MSLYLMLNRFTKVKKKVLFLRKKVDDETNFIALSHISDIQME